MNIIHQLGENGPGILFILSLLILHTINTNILFYYVFGSFISEFINLVLKYIFKEPRPKNNKYIINKLLKYDIYGMPSGHAQMAFFTTIFIYLAFNRKKYIMIAYLMYSILISYQRVKENYHTVNQVFVGGIIGLLFGYFYHKFIDNY